MKVAAWKYVGRGEYVWTTRQVRWWRNPCKWLEGRWNGYIYDEDGKTILPRV